MSKYPHLGVNMDPFKDIEPEFKAIVVDCWKHMSETDKTHFINQVALALSVWGSDDQGKELAVGILKSMVSDGSSTLADFGLYVNPAGLLDAGLKNKVKRASLILEGYRIKHSLPSEPHKDLAI